MENKKYNALEIIVSSGLLVTTLFFFLDRCNQIKDQLRVKNENLYVDSTELERYKDNFFSYRGEFIKNTEEIRRRTNELLDMRNTLSRLINAGKKVDDKMNEYNDKKQSLLSLLDQELNKQQQHTAPPLFIDTESESITSTVLIFQIDPKVLEDKERQLKESIQSLTRDSLECF